MIVRLFIMITFTTPALAKWDSPEETERNVNYCLSNAQWRKEQSDSAESALGQKTRAFERDLTRTVATTQSNGNLALANMSLMATAAEDHMNFAQVLTTNFNHCIAACDTNEGGKMQNANMNRKQQDNWKLALNYCNQIYMMSQKAMKNGESYLITADEAAATKERIENAPTMTDEERNLSFKKEADRRRRIWLITRELSALARDGVVTTGIKQTLGTGR